MKILELYSKKYGKFNVLLDDNDYEKVIKYTWHIVKHTTSFVVQRHIYKNNIRTGQLLHRFILNIDDPKISIDHKSGNTMDNQRSNLRIASYKQNSQNTKVRKTNKLGIKGVCYHKASKKYRAKINDIWLGIFDTPEEASEVYEQKAKELFGEFYRKPK